MNREVVLAFLAVTLLTRADGFPRVSSGRGERRVRRQASRIPYAALSTGAIRSRTPSSSSGRGSATSTGSGGSSRASTGLAQRGNSAGYPQIGSSEGGVPMGHSTYPFGVSRYTNSQNLQTPYSDQSPPGTGSSYSGQASSRYQQTYSQPPNPYQSYGYGSVGGYAAVPTYNGGYGGNPYIYGGGLPQVPYNTYAWGQPMGYTGAGYGTAGGYGDISGRATIGSAYRDPNSRFTSWVHPRGETSNRYSGTGSYRNGGTGRGSYYGSSSYGSSSGRYVSGTSGGGYTDPYGSYSSGSQDSSAGSNPYAQIGSSENQYSNYLGGGSSVSSTAGVEDSYPSRGSGRTGPYSNGGDVGNYGSQDAYGSSSGAFGTNNRQGNSDVYGGSYGATDDDPYSQSRSRYGGTSSSRYDSFGRSGGSGRQSSQSYRGSQSGSSQGGGRQPGRFYMAESSSPSNSNEEYSSAVYSSRYSSGRTSLQGTPRQHSQTSGRFFNPDSQRQRPDDQTAGSSPSYQNGRFYNQQQPSGSSQEASEPRPSQARPPSLVTVNPNAGQQQPSSRREESTEALPLSGYYNQPGTFLVGRRPDVSLASQQNNTKHLHPSQKKCQRLDDGLPDLYLDYKKMTRSVHLSKMPLSNLSCATTKEADCLSASAYGRDRITTRRLLRFNTIAHNIGTADFLPNLHRDDWIFHPCHKHWHSMKEFAHFHLFDRSGTLVGEGHKVSFCLQDSDCKNPCQKSYDCKNNTQGISPGCRDVYEASYDCQWVDVTDVPTGAFKLRVTVNPVVDGDRAVPELSYTNNVVECDVRISVTEAEALSCRPVDR